jgi:peptidoglycan/xylan/chitin deacetylase (PgdA/CDA1 family)
MSLTFTETMTADLGQERQTAPPLSVPRGKYRRPTWRQRALQAASALVNSCCGPREQRAFGILMYHRIVDPPPGHPKPTWSVTPERFDQQLSGLLARGWQACPLSQLIARNDRELPLPRKTFVVTIDDGYVNNLLHAYPILTRLHVPATVFLATAYLDSNRPFPSDDWQPAGQPGVPTEAWRPMTSEECRRLAANGLVELGAHTHTHADFRGRPDSFAADLQQNLEVLRERFGIERPTFAFPYGTKADGFVSSEFAARARDAGVLCSLTTEPGIIRPGDSPFDWGRFAVTEYDTAGTLAAKLGGWHETLRGLGRRVKGRF